MKQADVLTHVTRGNGWDLAVYICYMTQNFVSRIEFIGLKLPNLSAHVYEVGIIRLKTSTVNKHLQMET